MKSLLYSSNMVDLLSELHLEEVFPKKVREALTAASMSSTTIASYAIERACKRTNCIQEECLDMQLQLVCGFNTL